MLQLCKPDEDINLNTLDLGKNHLMLIHNCIKNNILGRYLMTEICKIILFSGQ